MHNRDSGQENAPAELKTGIPRPSVFASAAYDSVTCITVPCWLCHASLAAIPWYYNA